MRPLLTILLLAALSGVPAASSSLAQALPAASPSLSNQPQDFTLKDLEGKARSLKAVRGKVVVVNFWATWCGPCRIELPQLNALYDRLKGSPVAFYSVNVDNAQTVKGVARQVKDMGIKYPILLDTDNQVVMKYNTAGIIPYTLILDAKGVIRHIHEGYQPGDERIVEQEIRTLLKQGATPGKGAK